MTLRLIQRWAEFKPKEEFKGLPRKRRGLYVLYRKRCSVPGSEGTRHKALAGRQVREG